MSSSSANPNPTTEQEVRQGFELERAQREVRELRDALRELKIECSNSGPENEEVVYEVVDPREWAENISKASYLIMRSREMLEDLAARMTKENEFAAGVNEVQETLGHAFSYVEDVKRDVCVDEPAWDMLPGVCSMCPGECVALEEHRQIEESVRGYLWSD
ncbi:hypothetical protein M426DRAFT_259501 [Hypoxylon sp. CI-4A]|nr:hypothetical protein M426DRAFT_259501 [Hypoxylon sp. CI-4A]